MNKISTYSSVVALSIAMTAPASLAIADEAAEVEAFEEIIVTAQKRDERMIDVPISMSAFSSESIDQTGVRELKGIADYIPNLQISQANDFRSLVTIRGVGAQSRNIGFDTRVGVYVDGVYMGQSPAINQELLDIQQVEVMRGPQGTLFGKNSVAGAINIISKKPGDEFEGSVSADFGNLNYREFKGMVTIPMGEKVSSKFAISKVDRDGYIPNLTTGNDLIGRDVLSYRAQIRIQASESFEINASFDGLNSDSLILVGEPSSDTFNLIPNPYESQDRAVAFDLDPDDKRDIYGGSIDLDYETEGGFILKSITGYRDTHGVYHNDTDYSPLDLLATSFDDRFKQFSQEIQFISPDDEKLTYMGGLYFYNQKADSRREAVTGDDFLAGYFGVYLPGYPTPVLQGISDALNFGGPGGTTSNYGKVDTNAYAAYFNGSYEITDKMTFGFGLRYTQEKKETDWISDGRASGQPLTIPAPFVNLPGLDGNPIGSILNIDSVTDVGLYSPATAAALAPFTQLNAFAFNIGSTVDADGNIAPLIQENTDKFLSPAFSLSYALSDDANVYAKYSTGFKSAGFNLDYINAAELAAKPDLFFDKETVKSYEIGLKGVFLDNKLQLSMAAFLAKYNNYQVNQFVDLGGGRTSIRITNAAKVKTQGIEIEASLKATDSLTFSGSLGYLDAKFDSFPAGGAQGADVSGNRLPNAPKFNLAFSTQFYHEIEGLDADLLIRGDITHRSDYFTTVNNNTTSPFDAVDGSTAFDNIEALTMINGRIGLISHNETWEIYFWGRNLTNQHKYVDDLRDFFGTIARLPNQPRTFGAELIWNF